MEVKKEMCMFVLNTHVCAIHTCAPSPFLNVVTGALAGALAATFVYPLEITKTRLAVAPAGTYRCARVCAFAKLLCMRCLM